MNYTGNAIYDFVCEKGLDYYYSAEHTWMLIYGDAESRPKIMVFVNKVENINNDCRYEEKIEAKKALDIANYFKLPFIFVRFMENNEEVRVWEERVKKWRTLTYDQLRDIFEAYGVVESGTAKKRVNQYTSSPYHDWQRNNLGRITVSDFDLIKYQDNEVKEIVELKRSKIPFDYWNPYENDYPNFALIINTIVGSEKRISFTLYYNLMKEGERGMRQEDISKIKVFDFVIPNHMISSSQVRYSFKDYYTLEQLLIDRMEEEV